MLTAWFTFIALGILLGSMVSKVLCLARRGIFAQKDFLWSSLEMVFSSLSLAFLLIITITTAYNSTIDELLLANALESSIYLYVGGFLFAIVGFLFIIELFTIIVNDVWNGRKLFMPSNKRTSFMEKSAKTPY